MNTENVTFAKVVGSDGKLIKEGVIVGRTTHGVNVMSIKNQPPFTDVEQFAEWFPYNSKLIKVTEFKQKRRR